LCNNKAVVYLGKQIFLVIQSFYSWCALQDSKSRGKTRVI